MSPVSRLRRSVLCVHIVRWRRLCCNVPHVFIQVFHLGVEVLLVFFILFLVRVLRLLTAILFLIRVSVVVPVVVVVIPVVVFVRLQIKTTSIH